MTSVDGFLHEFKERAELRRRALLPEKAQIAAGLHEAEQCGKHAHAGGAGED